MDEIKSWFEVPAIAHFFHVFKSSFGLIEFEIEDFEEALFLDSAENVSSFLPDLVIQLLRGLYKTKDGLQVTMENYNNYLQDLLEYRYVTLADKKNPITVETYKAVSTRQKVEILYDMCNWRLEMEDAMELSKNLEAEEMRVMPVGSDDKGYQFWYFYGTRLYRERCCPNEFEENGTTSENDEISKVKPKSKKKRGKKRKIRTKSGRAVKQRLDYDSQTDPMSEDDKDDEESESENIETKIELDEKPVLKPHNDNEWSLVCSTVQDWSEIVSQYENARNRNEKSLLKGLKELNGVMPNLFEEKEKALQRKLLAMAPRRSSDRILIKVQIREEEHRRKEQERIFKNQLKVKEAEKRQKELQFEKEKEREKRCQERERNLEMRALRAKQREELKLVAENPELAKELQLANKDKVNYLKLDYEGEEDDKYFAMDRVLEVVKDDDDAWPFLEAVNEDEAPNYYDYIKEPMDLSIITSKVKSKNYKNKTEFEDDMYLMFDNCETYNGTYSSYTKLAYKVKKVFERQMKKEFPPEKINKDELYEDEEKKKSVKVKTPKEQQIPKVLKEKKPKEPSALQALKKNNIILTPEFAHAQILQAQARMLHKTQTQQSSSQGTNIPQILPKLGIPQDVLAKLTPAQMQSLLMQLRAGTLSSHSISGTSPIAPKILAPSTRLSFTNSQSSSHLNITPNSIVNVRKQVPRLIPKQPLITTQVINSSSNLSNLKIASPGTMIRTNANAVQYIATPNGQLKNLSFISNNKTALSPKSSLDTSKISTVLLQRAPTSSQVVLGRKMTIPNTLQSITPAKATKLSSTNQSPFSGQLVIQGKSTSILPQLKKLEAPVLGQSNIRYVGQPNGQLQKIVYLQTPNSNSIRQPTFSKVNQQATIRVASPSNTLTNRPSAQTPRQVVPIYLTPQGVPLQVVRPGSSALLTASPTKLLTNNQVVVSKAAIPGHVSSTPMQSTNNQNLHGLKKAVQQVAAVTQISAKLQNHLENKNLLPRTPVQTATINNLIENKNKVIIKPFNNDRKVLNSPIAMKVPVASLKSPYILSAANTTPKIIATTTNTSGTGVMLSPIRSISNVAQPQSIKGLLPGAKQSNVSFILTSSGLVSVSLPSSIAPQLAVLSESLASTQNIITSRIPSVFTAQAKPSSTITSSVQTPMIIHQTLPRVNPVSVTPMGVQQTIQGSNSTTIAPIAVQQISQTSNSVAAPQIIQQSVPSTSHAFIGSVGKSVITPEKLRDAEALLGLINPTHLKPTSSSQPTTENKTNSQSVNTGSIYLTNSPLKTVSALTNGSPVKKALLPNSNVRISPHKKAIITTSPLNQVKIQLPSSNLQQISPQRTVHPATNGNPQTSNIMKFNNGTSVATGPKMIVDAAQLLKLREEGKLMVSPNGQMFLLANTVSKSSK